MIDMKQFFDLEHTSAASLFEGVTYPWEVLPMIGQFVQAHMAELEDDFTEIKKDVWVGHGTTISDCTQIDGPTIIGKNCEIRHGAYIRGKVLIGDGVVIGNSSEIKNAIIFDNGQVPHFNYVGDSVLGYKAHIGAGVKLSNLKSDKSLVKIIIDGETIETGIKKFGAMIGDRVEVGCNAVLNPGTVLGNDANVYPLTFVRGYIPANHILKQNGDIVKKHE